MKNKIRSYLQTFIGWPLTIVALFFIGKFITPNLPEIFIALHNMQIFFLLLGILSIVIYFFIRCYFWQQMLQQKGFPVPFKEMTWLWGASEFNRYVPGNIWTFLGRTHFFSQKNISKKQTFTFFLLEVEFIICSCLLLSLFAASFLLYAALPHFAYTYFLIILVCIVTLIAILCFLANDVLLSYLYKKQKIFSMLRHILPSFSFQTNLNLFTIQTLALFFFGLGTYFSISSLHLLYPLYIPTFIGLFVFSLLVGYVSFITPMGLGVREGVITTGLSKFMTVALAGFSALFARVIFIISEVCFLLIALYWYKDKHGVADSVVRFLKKHWQIVLLFIGVLLYVLYFSAASFARYDNFYAGRFDLGNMDQTVWNTLHGHIFQQTDANGTAVVSRLAYHADFILILLAPLYILWQDPRMLLLIQAIALASGAIFVFFIASDVLKNKSIALLFSIAYLINPAVNFTNLYDFHAVTLATSLFLGAFYFLKKYQYGWCVLFLILAGLTKEEVWIVVALFGIYMSIATQHIPRQYQIWQRIVGLVLCIAAPSIAYYLVSKAIPQANGGAHFALAFYSDFGSSPIGIIKTIFLQPQKTLITIFQPGQLVYLFQLFAPLGFLSLLAPGFLLFTGPDFAVDLLSSSPPFHQIYYQYSAVITPFLFIAAIYGFTTAVRKYQKRLSIIFYYLLTMVVLNSYFFGPLPGSLHPSLTMFDSPLPYAQTVENFLDSIPKQYSIAATNNVGAHLSHRQKIFTIPVGINKADIVIFLLNDPTAQPSLAAQKTMAENMKRDKNYIEVFKQGDFIVFEKRKLYIQKEPNASSAKLFPMSIFSLQHRDYIGGTMSAERKIDETSFASTYLVSYPSDGLKQYAFMEIPHKSPAGLPIAKDNITNVTQFPVLILNHDISSQVYDTITSDSHIADYFAFNGFLVLKPDYRGNAQSEIDDTSLVPLPYSIDVLNIISSLQSIPQADRQNIFLWGQGIGGEVALKALAITGDTTSEPLQYAIKGAALWAPVIDPSQWSNETDNYKAITNAFGSPRNNPVFWQSISARNYLDDIRAPIEIDQGTSDITIPYTSSIELYDDLVSLNKNAKLRLFPNDTHDLSQFQHQALSGNVRFFRSLISHKE